jgi:hypothetical protein
MEIRMIPVIIEVCLGKAGYFWKKTELPFTPHKGMGFELVLLQDDDPESETFWVEGLVWIEEEGCLLVEIQPAAEDAVSEEEFDLAIWRKGSHDGTAK